jgi:hypothetical protein
MATSSTGKEAVALKNNNKNKQKKMWQSQKKQRRLKKMNHCWLVNK